MCCTLSGFVDEWAGAQHMIARWITSRILVERRLVALDEPVGIE